MEEEVFSSNNSSSYSDFFLSDGSKITSLEDLAETISRMNFEVFYSHVKDDRNDFANWVEHTHHKNELANQLRSTKNLNETIKILYDYSSTKHDLVKHEETEVSVYDEGFAEKQIEFVEEHSPNVESTIPKLEEPYPVEPENPVEKKEEKLVNNSFFGKVKNFFLGNSVIEDFDDPFELFENKSTKIFQEESLAVYEPEFLKTEIPGFDELISDGIPKGSSILLSGGPGTGKTTLSLNLLNNASLQGMKCLYLTFEEEASRLRSHMKNYGWDPIKLEKEGTLKILKMEPFAISRSIEALLAKASGELVIELDTIEGIIPKGFKPEIIILDSLSSVASAFIGKQEGYRIYVEQLFNMFKKIGATSFFISEVEEDAKKYTRNGVEEFLADGVIVLYNLREKNVRVNAIEILKIRGTNHKKKIVPFKIVKGKGITVFPKESPFTLS